MSMRTDGVLLNDAVLIRTSPCFVLFSKYSVICIPSFGCVFCVDLMRDDCTV